MSSSTRSYQTWADGDSSAQLETDIDLAQRLEDFVLDSVRDSSGEAATDLEDPLMVECVECGRWVVAAEHKNNLAVGYCCESVLVSRIDA
jgi:hypothetical protein